MIFYANKMKILNFRLLLYLHNLFGLQALLLGYGMNVNTYYLRFIITINSDIFPLKYFTIGFKYFRSEELYAKYLYT